MSCPDQTVHCIDTSFTIESSINFFSLFVIVPFLTVLILEQTISLTIKFQFYIRAIRDRYGGFSLFNYLISLFSQGILHVRVF